MNRVRSRRDFLKTAGMAGLAGAAASCSTTQRGQEQTPLNFVVILTDDQAFRDIGYNNSIVKTPNLDRLAHDGIIFGHSYVASPICVASRASIMTGLFPQQHGAIALEPKGFVQSVIEQGKFKTIPQMLSSAGYDTLFCGKSHIAKPRDYGFAQGQENSAFDDADTFASAQKLLEQRRGSDKPFLLWVAPHQPHVPLKPAQQWLDLYKDAPIDVDPNFRESPPEESFFNQGTPGEHFYRDSTYTKNYKDLPSGPPRSREMMKEFIRAYCATTSHLDAQIGEFIELLKKSGEYENTVIIFLSDNGYFLGNHGLGNKITMHEESVRVPMFVHWTGLSQAGIWCQSLVSSLDVFPTLLDLAGIPVASHLQGLSLRPLFTHPDRQLREYVASECVGVGGKKGEGHRMVRTAKWKYILSDTNEEALFDEEKDPYELNNVVGDTSNQDILQEMRRYVNKWMDSVGDIHRRPGE